ncbi:hypothetical protein [Paraburkholderia rhizosphaerae]|uniref:Uncharacterized protein n=1 Tax=Paraburkholderia rhizosphaerae TaxID=480658 RepID=A0A4R8LZT3_9BURK|nr:hypothetical protein [Paraburkholderia rhizosphaerae]TDY54042.1 hypothetical protein BX592_102189 [Paraburkholderia rhizosphaerae]
MQARKSCSLLVVPVMLAVHGLACAADATPLIAAAAQAQAVGPAAAVPVAADAPSVPGSAPAVVATSPQAPQATHATSAAQDDVFGVAMTAGQLDAHRGGDALIGQNDLTGTVANNTANRVVTGSNSISEGSFANSSGLPTVIQNSGANVLIQNATVLNVRFGN